MNKRNTKKHEDVLITVSNNRQVEIIRAGNTTDNGSQVEAGIQSEKREITNNDIDQLALGLLTDKKEKAFAVVSFENVSISNHQQHSLHGTGSVKSIGVDIHSTQAEDEASLHYLLRKTQE